MTNSVLDLSTLNEPQREAVLATEGPLLVLAGAGSGKTRVLTNRIAHLIEDLGVMPEEILAITFTNKAAAEMRSRLGRQVRSHTGGMWVATFHAACVRILRADGFRLGYTSAFSIYDDDDQKRLVKEVAKYLGMEDKAADLNAIRNRISSAKNQLIKPDEYEKTASSAITKETARVYREYQRRLVQANAMDFDDLLMNTVELFRKFPDVLGSYQARFRYIHVDEYQDTNHAQYTITQLLAARHRNLMVVGDDDQSIYSWRGADITNILEFERDYPEAKVVKLEQNYRSTGTILAAANAVVANNRTRKPKTLFTDEPAGEKVGLYLASNEKDEARFVVAEIERIARQEHMIYRDFAIFYRTNSQSRVLEDALLRAGIPYKIVGGTRFFDRAEIRDTIAYLRLAVNPADDMSFARIINTPRRGIGNTTIDHIGGIAASERVPLLQAAKIAAEREELRAASLAAVRSFVDLATTIHSMEGNLVDIVEMIIERTGMIRAYEADRTEESATRAENIREFVNVVVDFAASHDGGGTLAEFTEWLALRTDLDTLSTGDDNVTLMTVHVAKGLEYPVVFVTGLEEGIFPHQNSAFSESGIEEERRLAYVAITRARKKLILCRAMERMSWGSSAANPGSRFIDEIPKELLQPERVGSLGYGGFGHDKRGDRHGTSSHGSSYGGSDYGSGTSRRSSEYGSTDDSPAFGRSGTSGGEGTGANRSLSGRGRGVGMFGKGGAKAASSGASDGFAAGDTVDHRHFGLGRVLSVSGDQITIEFDGAAGIKKLLVGYAPIVKVTGR